MSSYDIFQVIDAVGYYYGVGSDQWLAIAKHGINATDAVKILDPVPGIDLVFNADKTKVLNMSLSENCIWNSTKSTAINSNLETGVSTINNSMQLSIPAATKVSTTGTLELSSGIGYAADTGLTVAGIAGTVCTAVGAVSAGIQLGKIIDSTLYNANPDFWDNNGMSTLNPDTWNTITADDTSINAKIFDTVFGLNITTPQEDVMQMYMDERALAYSTAYMGYRGVFDNYSKATLSDTSTLNYYDLYNQPIAFNINDATYNNNSVPYYNGDSFTTTQQTEQYSYSNNTAPIYMTRYSYKSSDGFFQQKPLMISTAPFNCSVKYTVGSSTWTETGTIDKSFSDSLFYTTVGQNNLFTETNTQLNKNPNNFISPSSTDIIRESMIVDDLYKIITQGNVVSGGVTGIYANTDSTQFDPTAISDWTDINSVLNALKQQYPELFTKAVTTVIPQQDGTTQQITRVPVPIASAKSATDTQPISSTSSQTQPELLPTSDPIILKYVPTITSSDPPVNPVDTGGGSTPPVVIPAGSATALYTVYNPSQTQLNSFGAWLWSSSFVDQILKIFSDPMQAIIGLHKIFCTPSISGVNNIKVGYLDSGVSSNVVSSQYTQVSCGSVNVSEYFGNVFDYTPYTDVSIYLPFVGIVKLNISDIMRSSLTVEYTIDVLTGAGYVQVIVDRDSYTNVLYTYSCNTAVQYPLSSGSYMGIVAGITSIAGGIAGTIASGGALAPLLMGSASSALNMRTNVERSGGLSGNAGAMGGKIPYLIITRPQTALASSYTGYTGLGANETVKISSLTGYAKLSKVHIVNIPAPGIEIEEIQNMLESGVLI